eukprot:gene22399-biopygen7980
MASRKDGGMSFKRRTVVFIPKRPENDQKYNKPNYRHTDWKPTAERPTTGRWPIGLQAVDRQNRLQTARPIVGLAVGHA